MHVIYLELESRLDSSSSAGHRLLILLAASASAFVLNSTMMCVLSESDPSPSEKTLAASIPMECLPVNEEKMSRRLGRH